MTKLYTEKEVREMEEKHGKYEFKKYDLVLTQDPFVDEKLKDGEHKIGYWASAYCQETDKDYLIFWPASEDYDQNDNEQDLDDYINWDEYQAEEI